MTAGTSPTATPTLTTAPPEPAPLSLRAVSVWVFPAASIVAVALVGQWLGAIAAAAVVAMIGSAVLFVVGMRLPGPPPRAKLVLGSLLVGTLAVLALVITITPLLRGEEQHPPDLRGRAITQDMLNRLDLRGSDLSGARVAERDLRNESLAGAQAMGVDLQKARLDGVNMRGADLRGADLVNACLRGADLAGAVLSGARIDGADLPAGTLDLRNSGVTGRPAATPPPHCR